MAEAFIVSASASGTVNKLGVYVDVGSSATKLVVGLYANKAGDLPGVLLTQATLNNPTAGAWNELSVPTASVTAGTKYWLAVLGPANSGVLRFRDTGSGGKAQVSSQSNLASLPATWASGATYYNAPLAAYALGTATGGQGAGTLFFSVRAPELPAAPAPAASFDSPGVSRFYCDLHVLAQRRAAARQLR